jgi:hypothetical protein
VGTVSSQNVANQNVAKQSLKHRFPTDFCYFDHHVGFFSLITSFSLFVLTVFGFDRTFFYQTNSADYYFVSKRYKVFQYDWNNTFTRQLPVVPSNDLQRIVISKTGKYLIAGYRVSLNYGQSFFTVNNSLNTHICSFAHYATMSESGQIMYIYCIQYSYSEDPDYKRLFKSLDYGKTFSDANLPFNFSSDAVADHTGRRLLSPLSVKTGFLYDGQLCLSSDYGQSFQPLQAPIVN